VYRVLKEYADIEISRSLYPAPCVDVLILWLAMNRKATEALKVSHHTVITANSSLTYGYFVSFFLIE
jgi:hypothetical protein